MNLLDRILGCILGGAIGDAFGGAYENQTPPIDFTKARAWRLSLAAMEKCHKLFSGRRRFCGGARGFGLFDKALRQFWFDIAADGAFLTTGNQCPGARVNGGDREARRPFLAIDFQHQIGVSLIAHNQQT